MYPIHSITIICKDIKVDLFLEHLFSTEKCGFYKGIPLENFRFHCCKTFWISSDNRNEVYT